MVAVRVFRREEAPKAEKLVRDYVCAQCWGELKMRVRWERGKGVWFEVGCALHPEHEGFVRRSWAEKRRAESMSELMEARENLREALGIDTPTPEDVDPWKALGF